MRARRLIRRVQHCNPNSCWGTRLPTVPPAEAALINTFLSALFLFAPALQTPTPPAAKPADEPPIVTHHQITIAGKPLAYTVTTGLMPLKADTGEKEADIFYMAYTR